MIQSPINYCATPVQTQPSYNAVKIDIHNPKVTDGPQACQPTYPSAYAMPNVPYYNYQQANTLPAYYMTVPQPQTVCNCPNCQSQQNVQPQQTVVQQPVVEQPVPVVPAPVPQVPVQQVINNGVPAQQTITQNPAQPVIPEEVPPAPIKPDINEAEVVAPNKTMPTVDITPVLRGLQSNNMAEQSEALNKIGEAADNPAEVNKFLETTVLDALLGILNADISGLEAATPKQIEARTKLMNNQPLNENEKNLAMTLAPQEVAERNKQHALYSIAILQKALADEIEAKTGEKLSIEKLPAIDQVVNVVKSNPNPLLRISALVALAHLNKPEYKPVLTEIFQLAQNDQDQNVKQVATEALNKINA